MEVDLNDPNDEDVEEISNIHMICRAQPYEIIFSNACNDTLWFHYGKYALK
ncbi:hypothetical protein PENSUB_12555 [Penicillium subrubescens]|uniref:Uncharacterized protein n=1 Tax=Penicillium subrubescens TaxID=1316194 RepID=A0A1Q5SYD3_9EURO|nr:hypothetical protein PENSUB_12555 [Penicillium subrubescens]